MATKLQPAGTYTLTVDGIGWTTETAFIYCHTPRGREIEVWWPRYATKDFQQGATYRMIGRLELHRGKDDAPVLREADFAV